MLLTERSTMPSFPSHRPRTLTARARMAAYVAPTVCSLRERGRALGAPKGLLAAMRSNVVSHVGLVVSGVRAEVADKQALRRLLLPRGRTAFHGSTSKDLLKLAGSVPVGLHCPFATFPSSPQP